jgi:hypothetical protein
MAENAVLFTSYGFFRKALWGESESTKLTTLQKASCGSLAGICVASVLTPVELIKCRLQVQSAIGGQFIKYNGPIDCIVKTIQAEGLQGLYRGNLSMLMREIPGNFCWFVFKIAATLCFLVPSLCLITFCYYSTTPSTDSLHALGLVFMNSCRAYM